MLEVHTEGLLAVGDRSNSCYFAEFGQIFSRFFADILLQLAVSLASFCSCLPQLTTFAVMNLLDSRYQLILFVFWLFLDLILMDLDHFWATDLSAIWIPE